MFDLIIDHIWCVNVPEDDSESEMAKGEVEMRKRFHQFLDALWATDQVNLGVEVSDIIADWL